MDDELAIEQGEEEEEDEKAEEEEEAPPSVLLFFFLRCANCGFPQYFLCPPKA